MLGGWPKFDICRAMFNGLLPERPSSTSNTWANPCRIIQVSLRGPGDAGCMGNWFDDLPLAFASMRRSKSEVSHGRPGRPGREDPRKCEREYRVDRRPSLDQEDDDLSKEISTLLRHKEPDAQRFLRSAFGPRSWICYLRACLWHLTAPEKQKLINVALQNTRIHTFPQGTSEQMPKKMKMTVHAPNERAGQAKNSI